MRKWVQMVWSSIKVQAGWSPKLVSSFTAAKVARCILQLFNFNSEKKRGRWWETPSGGVSVRHGVSTKQLTSQIHRSGLKKRMISIPGRKWRIAFGKSWTKSGDWASEVQREHQSPMGRVISGERFMHCVIKKELNKEWGLSKWSTERASITRGRVISGERFMHCVIQVPWTASVLVVDRLWRVTFRSWCSLNTSRLWRVTFRSWCSLNTYVALNRRVHFVCLSWSSIRVKLQGRESNPGLLRDRY